MKRANFLIFLSFIVLNSQAQGEKIKYISINLFPNLAQLEIPVYKKLALKPGFSFGLNSLKVNIDLKYTFYDFGGDQFYTSVYYQSLQYSGSDKNSNSTIITDFYKAEYMGLYIGHRMKHFDIWAGFGKAIIIIENISVKKSGSETEPIGESRYTVPYLPRLGISYCINFRRKQY